MGDCFSISLNITLKNEAAAVRVMQEYIQNKPYVNFGLEENQKRGIGTDNFNDLIRIFFSSCNGTVIDVARNEDIELFRLEEDIKAKHTTFDAVRTHNFAYVFKHISEKTGCSATARIE